MLHASEQTEPIAMTAVRARDRPGGDVDTYLPDQIPVRVLAQNYLAYQPEGLSRLRTVTNADKRGRI